VHRAADVVAQCLQWSERWLDLAGVQRDIRVTELLPEEIEQAHLRVESVDRDGRVFGRGQVHADQPRVGAQQRERPGPGGEDALVRAEAEGGSEIADRYWAVGGGERRQDAH